MKTKLRTTLISVLCLGITTTAFSLQAQDSEASADKNMEKITVYSKKSIPQLKREITKTTKSFFKDYNKLNDNHQYAVICRKEKNPGSNFKSTSCEPRFVKTRRSDLMAVQQAGGFTTSLGVVEYGTAPARSTHALSKLNLLSSAAKIGVSRDQKFNAHVEKVLSENPELLKKYKEIMGLQSEYAYKRANR